MSRTVAVGAVLLHMNLAAELQGELALSHWSAFASPPLARTLLLFLPAEAVGTLHRLSAVRTMCERERKKERVG